MNKELVKDGTLGVVSVGLVKFGVDDINLSLKLFESSKDYWREICTNSFRVGSNQVLNTNSGKKMNVSLDESMAGQLRQECVDAHTSHLNLIQSPEFITGMVTSMAGVIAIAMLILQNRNYLSRLVRTIRS